MKRFDSRSWFALTLVGALSLGLAACGDDPQQTGPSGNASTDRTDPDGPGTAKSDPTKPIALPDLGPLSSDKAREVLHAPFGSLDSLDPEMVRSALGMMARLGDRAVVAAVNAELLTQEDGTYDDTESAAIGLLTLHLLGEKDAAARILAHAKKVLDEGDIDLESVAIALDAVPGAESEALLIRIIESDDDEFGTTAALRALARRRSKAAQALFAKIAKSHDAGESTYTDEHHVLAIAGLLGLGDPAGSDQVGRWAASAETSPDLDDVLLLLGVPGLTECADAIVRIMAAVIEADAIGFEPSSAAAGVGEVFRDGGGEDYREHLRAWRDLADDDASDEANFALLRTGDTSVLPQLMESLKRAVTNPLTLDPTTPVAILETLADRGLAGNAELAKVLSVGAQLRPDANEKPGPKDRAMWLNCACAYVYLRSQK